MGIKRYQVPISDETADAIRAYSKVSKTSFPKSLTFFLDQLAPDILAMATALKKAQDGTAASALRATSERLTQAISEARAQEEQLNLLVTPEEVKTKKAS